MFEDVFIAIYTNQCKSYCDKAFFENLIGGNLIEIREKAKYISNAKITVVDNTESNSYAKNLDLRYGFKYGDLKNKLDVFHIDVPKEPLVSRFQRNVTESLLFLRQKFLEGDYKYFVILESDVIPEDPNWLSYLLEVTDQADIIGGLYYKGFHNPDLWDGPDRVVPTHHVLSGCTLYKREVIENIPFRYDPENLGPFPDALISYDSNRNGNSFRLANYTKIKCKHLEVSPGNRSQTPM